MADGGSTRHKQTGLTRVSPLFCTVRFIRPPRPARACENQADCVKTPYRNSGPIWHAGGKWDGGLYSLLGIGRGDIEKMRQQYARNFRFFEAPVGVIFTIDRRLEIGSWLDYGMFLQSVMVAARGLGLDTCPLAAFANFPNTVRAALELPFQDVIVCGMAIGYADPEAAENKGILTTEEEHANDMQDLLDAHQGEPARPRGGG